MNAVLYVLRSRRPPMITPGFETTDPITETRLVVVKGAQETAGRGWVTEVHCPEGAAPSVAAHIHRTWTETFEILEGTASYRLGTTVRTLATGETVAMPPGIPHVHPWNTGSGVMIYRQTNDFGAATPEAVDDVLGTFATINGLAREGRIGKKGIPKNPLQAAATIRMLTKHGAFDAVVPIPLQLALSATFGRLAEALGYRAVYDRYLR
jgi:quercetin dioxygenase-like cupin family protein